MDEKIKEEKRLLTKTAKLGVGRRLFDNLESAVGTARVRDSLSEEEKTKLNDIKNFSSLFLDAELEFAPGVNPETVDNIDISQLQNIGFSNNFSIPVERNGADKEEKTELYSNAADWTARNSDELENIYSSALTNLNLSPRDINETGDVIVDIDGSDIVSEIEQNFEVTLDEEYSQELVSEISEEVENYVESLNTQLNSIEENTEDLSDDHEEINDKLDQLLEGQNTLQEGQEDVREDTQYIRNELGEEIVAELEETIENTIEDETISEGQYVALISQALEEGDIDLGADLDEFRSVMDEALEDYNFPTSDTLTEDQIEEAVNNAFEDYSPLTEGDLRTILREETPEGVDYGRIEGIVARTISEEIPDDIATPDDIPDDIATSDDIPDDYPTINEIRVAVREELNDYDFDIDVDTPPPGTDGPGGDDPDDGDGPGAVAQAVAYLGGGDPFKGAGYLAAGAAGAALILDAAGVAHNDCGYDIDFWKHGYGLTDWSDPACEISNPGNGGGPGTPDPGTPVPGVDLPDQYTISDSELRSVDGKYNALVEDIAQGEAKENTVYKEDGKWYVDSASEVYQINEGIAEILYEETKG